MHDALARYEPDTVVVDVERPTTRTKPTSPRAHPEELTMQVLADGAWHRRTPDLKTTACGMPLHSQFSPVRREELRHPLSRACGCFTSFELARADQLEAADRDG